MGEVVDVDVVLVTGFGKGNRYCSWNGYTKRQLLFFLYGTGLGYYKCRAVGKVEWRVRYGLVFTSYRMAIILWIFYAKKFISVDQKKWKSNMEI